MKLTLKNKKKKKWRSLINIYITEKKKHEKLIKLMNYIISN